MRHMKRDNEFDDTFTKLAEGMQKSAERQADFREGHDVEHPGQSSRGRQVGELATRAASLAKTGAKKLIDVMTLEPLIDHFIEQEESKKATQQSSAFVQDGRAELSVGQIRDFTEQGQSVVVYPFK